MTMDWLALGTFIAGFFGGYSVKAVLNLRSNRSSGSAEASDSSVAQSGNVAGGNIAGRDVKINKK